MPEEPTELPRWADDGGVITEPSEGKKDIGWISGERPPFQYFNWLLNLIYEWLDWLSFKTSIPGLFEARLTLTTGVPVTVADVTLASTIYLTPYKGNRVSLYDGALWKPHVLAEISIAVPNVAANKQFDLFLYDNAGTLTLEAVAWTNDTTRATALALQDGVYVKSGTLTKRYVGSFRTGDTGGGEDKVSDDRRQRFLWNYYNRVKRTMQSVFQEETWDYTTATWRKTGNIDTYRLDMMVGVREDMMTARVLALAKNTSANVQVSAGIGLNSLTNPVTASGIWGGAITQVANQYVTMESNFNGVPSLLGYNYVQALEISAATGTTSWLGFENATGKFYYIGGIMAEVMA